MKYFTTANDVADINRLAAEALALKKNPHAFGELGRNRTLGLFFLNPSLRTRMSTQKAAQLLGMNVLSMNMGQDGWALEFEDGVVMNGTKAEHIREAAAVLGEYCDIIGLRNFPSLNNRDEDYSEKILLSFMKHCKVPLLSLESATLHPLQSLADLITINEHKPAQRKPKVVLTWAPHVRALPQAVANSFSEWMCKADVDFTITHPQGMELCEDYTQGAHIEYDQDKTLEEADFIYVKNWSSFHNYGRMSEGNESWMLTPERLSGNPAAKIMHCLPVRRDVELSSALLDSSRSLVTQQAANRVFAAMAVLKQQLEYNYPAAQHQLKNELITA